MTNAVSGVLFSTYVATAPLLTVKAIWVHVNFSRPLLGESTLTLYSPGLTHSRGYQIWTRGTGE
jgi:hypothetical protein